MRIVDIEEKFKNMPDRM